MYLMPCAPCRAETLLRSPGSRPKNHRKAMAWCAGAVRVRAGQDVQVFCIGMHRFGICLAYSVHLSHASSSNGFSVVGPHL